MENLQTDKIIILAGATGHLGGRIAHYLLQRGATVRALVRKGADIRKLNELKQAGIMVVEVDYNNPQELAKACEGGICFISAVSGLGDVIVDAQTKLLEAAVKVGVPRFIPSDFSIDFTKLPDGSNRNLDLRRQFSRILDKAPIQATSILNGMFTDLLTGQAPVILSGPKLVLHWGSADQLMDFTTIENTAEFTAAAALDPKTPRYLRVAGEVATVRQLRQSAEEASGNKFRILRAGGLGFLNLMIKMAKTLAPQKGEVFPAWQGMQYLHNMLSGLPKLQPLDNTRYPEIRWTSVKEVLANATESK
ncbi:NmrA family NAD(P)-binding protein [Dyadobacter luticola]|uniref:NmrA family protein n=1 Tax=Dyadobacter luticola TaxID=1979387 RepID=A0A5R9L1E5_9BACT|nr:NmrA family NAD(P)-binding protein [Dyadobacter luticola]TLV02179.1 NmrA family protein [Dyadobacter luticola]